MKKDHIAKQEIQVNSGVTAGQAMQIVKANGDKVNVQVGNRIGLDLGNDQQENVVPLGDLDPSVGIVVANPITNQPETIIGKDNFVHNLDGTLTARSQKHKDRG